MPYYRPPDFRNLLSRRRTPVNPPDSDNDYYRPPPPPTPVVEEPSRIARAAAALKAGMHGVGSAVGAPGRGLGLMADLAQENLTETPEEFSRVRLNAPPSQGGVLSDIFSPTVEAPGTGQVAMEGLGMLSGARLPAINRPGAMVPVEEDPIQRAIRQDPTMSRTMAVAEPLAELGTSFGSDPALGLLGAGAGGGRIARAAERLIGAGMVPGMAAGAYEGGKEFLRQGGEKGYTSPEALKAGTQATIDAILAAGGIGAALRRGPRPEVLEGEYIPPLKGLPAAPPRQLEAPIIDVEGRVVPDEVGPGAPAPMLPPDLSPSAPLRRQLERAHGTVPLRPPVDASGAEGAPVEAVPSLLPTPGGSLVRGRVFRGGEAPDALETAVEQALGGRPAPPRVNDYVDPETLGMQPLESAVEPNVQRQMRKQGRAERAALADLEAERAARPAPAPKLTTYEQLTPREQHDIAVTGYRLRDINNMTVEQVREHLAPMRRAGEMKVERERTRDASADEAQVRLAQEDADRALLTREVSKKDQENAALQERLDQEQRGYPRGAAVPVPSAAPVQPVPESRISRAAEALAARRPPPPIERATDRRLAQVPVAEERRAGQDRRARIAAENGLPVEHPAVEKLAQHEERAAKGRDELTGLLDKPAWDARRAQNPHHAVLSADVAEFKKTNDRYGHKNADLILKALGEHLGTLAGPDRAARPHGDEMMADFDTIEEAQAAAAKLHEHAAGLQIEVAMPDGTRETITGVRVHTGTGVKSEHLGAEEAADFDLNQRAESERRARKDGRGLAAEAPRAPGEGRPDRVGEAGTLVPAAQAPAEVVPAKPRSRKTPLGKVGDIVRAKADWNAFPEEGAESGHVGKAGEYRISAVDDQASGETYLTPVGGGKEVLAAREGEDFSNFEPVKKPANVTSIESGRKPGSRELDPDKMLEGDVDWRDGHVTNLVGEGGWTVASKNGDYSDHHYGSAEEAKDYLAAAESKSKVDFFHQDEAEAAAEAPQPKKRPGSFRWQMLDKDGVGVGSGFGRTADEAIDDYKAIGGREAVVSAKPMTQFDKPGPMAVAKASGESAENMPARIPESHSTTPEAHVAEAAARVEEAPSPAQMEAGNYRKGHVEWQGLNITLETAKGGTRTAKDGSWSVEDFPAHYGYIKRTEGKDGDHVDVYLGEDLKSERVWVVDQIDPKTKKFDEHKVMLGFPGEAAALKVYDDAFNDNSGPMRRGATTEMPLSQFKAWIENGDTKAPVAYTQPAAARAPVDKTPEKADIPAGESSERPAPVPATAASNPARGNDREALAGAPPEDVRAAPEGGKTEGGGVRGPGADVGGARGSDAEGSELPPSLGTGEGGVGAPADGGGRPEPRVRPRDAGPAVRDYRIQPADEVGAGGPRAKAKTNIEAIRTLKTIEKEGRPATPEEQKALVKYSGWGGLPQIFDEHNRDHAGLREDLKGLLTDEEWESARASTPNAHYTSPAVVEGMWKAIGRLGLARDANILEPSMGAGHFFGLQPESLLPAKRTGVELDSLTGRIASLIYPEANVHVKGFEAVPLPDGFFDLAISNVPFGNYPVHDPKMRKQAPALTKSIHDYFFAKALDKVRPGGVVAFITSNFTMDKSDSTVRKYLASKADLLGAIRLPNTAFKANAGTEVTTDVIFLQRRAEGEKPSAMAWAGRKDVKGKNGEAITVNEYFADHPEMMLGKMEMAGTMYRGDSAALVGQFTPEAFAAAVKHLPEGAIKPWVAPTRPNEARGHISELPDAGTIKDNGYGLKDGALVIRDGDKYRNASLPAKAAAAVKAMLPVRDAVRRVFKTQLEEATDADILGARKTLNKTYDSFVKAHGPINAPENRKAFHGDPDAPLLLSLEKYDPDAKTAEKAEVFSKRTIERYKPVASAGSASEALTVALNESGRLDWTRMQDLTGRTPKELQDELGNLAFRNPEGGGQWNTADEYLAGDVRAKLVAAEAAAKADKSYARNVEALKAVQPKDLEHTDIDVRIGSSWVPKEDVRSFVAHLLGESERSVVVSHAQVIGTWAVGLKGYAQGSVANTTEWGTARYNAHELVADALNAKVPTVYDRDSEGKAHVNEAETVAAREQQQKIKDRFKTWIWEDPERADRLARKYNDEFNNVRLRDYNGSHLTFPGMARATLRGRDLDPHQKNAVWRQLQDKATLLAHVVGAGKTFEMATAAMELRRLGLARKPMFVVPNHLVGQWASEFLRLYPSANILAAGKEHFEKGKRQQIMSRIATGSYDAVIVGHKPFESLPVSDDTFNSYLNEQIADLEHHIEEARDAEGKGGTTVKELEKAKKRLEAKLQTRANREAKDTTITFEELGVDAVFLDEAHLYKNLFFPTKMTRLAGVPQTESNRAFDMFIKTNHVRKMGGRTTFATGTMMRYLDPEGLREHGLQHFDSWAQNFAEAVTGIELAPDGSGYRSHTRLAKFTNLPELVTMFRRFSDVQTAEMLKLPRPKVEGGKRQTVSAPASPALKDYVQGLMKRAEAVRAKKVDPTVDNMLKITGDGSKAALDMRLVDPYARDDAGSKVNMAVKNVHDIWQETAAKKSAQLVFIDLSTPADPKERGKKFTVYDDMKAKLVKLGIPEKEIAFIHDAETDVQKQALFDAVNAGRIRVLFGSTEKMGAGTNVQRKLIALHHMDAPWRPSDIEQRQGRIERQGNENEKIRMYAYVTAGSFDAYKWQTLETKARFIGQVMQGDVSVRNAEDVSGGALTYAEVKAIASGNPAVMEKVKVDAELRKLDSLRAAHQRTALRIRRELSALPAEIASNQAYIKRVQSDMDSLEKAKAGGEDFSITVLGDTFTGEGARAKADEALVKAVGERVGFPTPTRVGKLLGFELWAKGSEETKAVSTWLQGPSGVHYSWSENVASAEANLRGLDGILARRENEVTSQEKKVADFKAQASKPFEHEARIAELVAKQKELDASLDLDKSDAQAAGGEEEEGGAGEEPAAGGLHEAAEQARERLRNRKPTANDIGAAAATGAEAWRDVTIIGADVFARGVRRFGEWARVMLKQVGDGVRSFLRKAFDEAQDVYRRYKGKADATAAAGAPPPGGKPPRAAGPAEPPKDARPVAERLGTQATQAGKRAQKIADTFESLNEKYTTAAQHAERVAAKGTIPKEERAGFRAAGQPDKEQTKGFRFSAEDIKRAGAEMVDAVREFRKAEQDFTRAADPDSAAAMRTARVTMENAVKRWQVYRSAAGRAVHTFNEPIPASVIEGLREAGVIAGKLTEVKERVPLTTNIINGLKNWKGLSDAERKQFAKDVVDHYRLNLFSVTSWTLDLIGNMAELAGQAGAGLGRDLVYTSRSGDVSFPSMQGLFRAIKAKSMFKPIEQSIEEALGTSVSGEHLREGEKGGTFTYRSNLGSKIYDYVVGGPLYAKGAFDTAAKRLGATWTIYRDAIEAAGRKGLKGGDREQFIEDFINNIPEETRKRAVENGNKAGFNRELTDLEEKIANSTTARLLVDTFARWPFQFTRWGAEMLGYRKDLYDKMRAGTLKPEEIGEYLGKVAVGLGGLYLVNQLYDRTDFNSMEYVDEQGNRVRLSNRDPIPTALWLLSVLKGAAAEASGDKKARDAALSKATAALRHASVPGARLLAGEGGLLGSLIKGFQGAIANTQNDPRALRREFEDAINRAIPGQALLGALKTAFDPVIREGIGANLPLVSLLQDAAINPVTGKPLEPRQRVAGIELPSISGTPIPGATRVLEPVQRLLSRYGLQVYRGPRSPVAGYPAGQMPEELQREWSEEFGKARNQLLTPLARMQKTLEGRPAEIVRKMIQQRDTAAAKLADLALRKKYGGPARLPRQATQRELAGPDAFRKP